MPEVKTVEVKDLFQSADWKAEKHVPVLDAPETAAKGAWVTVTATVGKEIPHPNKTDHHIAWIEILFHPEGEKFPYSIGRSEFLAHGAAIQGADTSTVYTASVATFAFKTDKPGTLLASSYCNIHGLWQSSKALKGA